MASDHVETLNHYRAHAAVNPTKTDRWSMDVNYIFPNVHIDSIGTGFLVHHFWPVSVDEAIQETRMYVRRPRTIRERIDRKSVVWGKSVSVRVDTGGGGIIKKKKSSR